MVHRTTMALLAVALVLSACGGGGDAAAGVASLSGNDVTATTAVSGEAATSDDPEEVEAAMLAWAECMRAEGVDVQDPTVDADGNVQLFAAGGGQGGPQGGDPGDREAMQAASAACDEHLEGVSLGFEQVDQTEMQDTLLAFASCMRDNGVDMPDPDISAFGPPDEEGAEEGDPVEGGPGQGGPFGGVDMDDPDFQAAQEACSDILGGFGPGGGGPGGGPGNTSTQEGDSDA